MAILRQSAARLAILVMAALAVAATASGASMRWYSSLEDAGAEARAMNRPMLLEFWADWCVPCKVMEQEVYTDQGFVDAARAFVPVRIDFDRKTALARKYRVEGLPTILVTNSYGDEIFRHTGVLDAARFTALLRELPHDMRPFNDLSRILARDRNNGGALEAMGGHLREAGLFRASNDYYARAMERGDARANPRQREAILAAMGANYLDVMDWKRAVEIFARCLKEFPTSARRPEWESRLIQAKALIPR